MLNLTKREPMNSAFNELISTPSRARPGFHPETSRTIYENHIT